MRPFDELRGRPDSDDFKRLAVVGGVATIYVAGWLGVAWRASRVGEAECVVERVPYRDGYCSVSHSADGSRHELTWDHCDRPTRWSASLHPGDTAHCYYYRSFLGDIFFEPSTIVWITPARIALLSVAFGLLAFGLAGWLAPRGPRRASGVATAGPDPDPYRVPDPPPPSLPPSPPTPRPPLALPVWRGSGGVLGWTIWTLFLVLGLVIVGVNGLSVWQASGEVTFGDLCIVASFHALPSLAALGILYRCGLVFDGERGVFFRWCGAGLRRRQDARVLAPRPRRGHARGGGHRGIRDLSARPAADARAVIGTVMGGWFAFLEVVRPAL